jgi:hypothetical protein
MNAFSHVYVMKTINRNPHSNEMRLTDRYNVKILMYTDVTSSQSTCTLIRFGTHLMTIGA